MPHECMSETRFTTSAEERLLSLQRFGIKLGLEQTRELLGRCGDPQNRLRFVHVAGTNGKGSVCAILAKALESAGLVTGFYSSPHLVSLRERIRVDSRGIAEVDLHRLVDAVWPHVEAMRSDGRCPTFFEVTTVMAALYFTERSCDVVVWETGMGGRYDATNVVTPLVSVITGVGLDHLQHLGDTIERIAVEKAGIIKPGVPLFLGMLDEAARRVVTAAATERNAPVETPPPLVSQEDLDDPFHGGRFFSVEGKTYVFALLGSYQWANLSLAVGVIKCLAEVIGFELAAALRGVAGVRWPGRFQELPDGLLLDGAHNPQGVASLVASLRHYFPSRKFVFVFASLEDKNPKDELRLMAPLASLFIFTPIANPPRTCFTPEALLAMAADAAPGVPARVAESLPAALAMARGAGFHGVIAGSLFLAGEALTLYYTAEDIINLNYPAYKSKD